MLRSSVQHGVISDLSICTWQHLNESRASIVINNSTFVYF